MRYLTNKLIFIYFLVILTGYNDSFARGCEKIESIAKNSRKIAYLNNWIQQNISNREILSLLGERGVVRAIDDPTKMDKLGINWGFLGFNKKYVSVKLYRNIADSKNYMDSKSIKSVRFAEGRNSIVILANDSSDLEFEGIEKIRGKVSEVSEGVFLICR